MTHLQWRDSVKVIGSGISVTMPLELVRSYPQCLLPIEVDPSLECGQCLLDPLQIPYFGLDFDQVAIYFDSSNGKWCGVNAILVANSMTDLRNCNLSFDIVGGHRATTKRSAKKQRYIYQGPAFGLTSMLRPGISRDY